MLALVRLSAPYTLRFCTLAAVILVEAMEAELVTVSEPIVVLDVNVLEPYQVLLPVSEAKPVEQPLQFCTLSVVMLAVAMVVEATVVVAKLLVPVKVLLEARYANVLEPVIWPRLKPFTVAPVKLIELVTIKLPTVVPDAKVSNP